MYISYICIIIYVYTNIYVYINIYLYLKNYTMKYLGNMCKILFVGSSTGAWVASQGWHP